MLGPCSKQCGSYAGNSGGPAFADLQQAKVAGVAFSKLSNADNVGYIIPYQIIKHFLQVCCLPLSCVRQHQNLRLKSPHLQQGQSMHLTAPVMILYFLLVSC